MEVGVYDDLNQIGRDDWLDINEYVFLYVGDLESEYVDDFENLSWWYTLPGLYYSCLHVITHSEHQDITWLIIYDIYLILSSMLS